MNRNNTIYKRLTDTIQGQILCDEPLADHCSYRIGGPADFYIYPSDMVDLKPLLNTIREIGIPRFVIGKGTNLLVSDTGFRGVVIDISRAFKRIVIDELRITAGAGILLERVTQSAIQAGLAGMENLSGIPGSIGGAVTLNAGAFGAETKDILRSVKVLDSNHKLKILARNDIEMGYRYTDLSQDLIILEAEFQMKSADSAKLNETRSDVLSRRAACQPLEFPSAGSVFKRPPGDYAGRLIEAAGLKGYRAGDAMISEKHANFIINCSAATADDVYRIIHHVQDTVLKKFGVNLKTEIHFLGF